MNTIISIGVYAIVVIIFFCLPFAWFIAGIRKANRESFIYKFFPAWLKWVVEEKYVFWK